MYAPSPETAEGQVLQMLVILSAMQRGLPYEEAAQMCYKELRALLAELNPDPNAFRFLCQAQAFEYGVSWPRAHGDSGEEVWQAFDLLSARGEQLCERLGLAVHPV